MVYIAHFRPVIRETRQFGNAPNWSFYAGMSNIAQNNERRHVIVGLVGGRSLMESAFRRLHDRYRRRLARITASVSKLFASVTPPPRTFALQRMCPFCGLITPRAKTCCLECGKSLAPATR